MTMTITVNDFTVHKIMISCLDEVVSIQIF